MNNYRWCLRALVCGSMLCACGVATARQDPGGLDPETREELRRGIERKYPDADPETRQEILRRIEATPKLRCAIEAITVYADGIVCRATLTGQFPFDCRVSLLGRSLSLVCMARLTDRGGNEWEVPPLRNHYTFVNLTEALSVPIWQHKSVHFVHVEKMESPRLVRVGPVVNDRLDRPAELRYSIATYGIAYTTNLRKQKSIYLVGRGKTPVEWKDTTVPPGIRTGPVDSPNTPEKESRPEK